MASSLSDLEHKAREAFIDDHFDLAVELYSQAIDLSPSNPELFADRAQANLKLPNFTEAVADASRAIALDALLHKAYMRKGTGYLNKKRAGNTPQRPSYPSSRPRSVDWAKLEAQLKKEEKDEKLDGDAALNKFFQDIYKDADEDTRSAMSKSFVESNGTVLSTNWKEVGTKKVEGSPPEGMEVKRWED